MKKIFISNNVNLIDEVNQNYIKPTLNKANRGYACEKIIFNFFGKEWTPDNIAHNVQGDIKLNGIWYSIKSCGCSLDNHNHINDTKLEAYNNFFDEDKAQRYLYVLSIKNVGIIALDLTKREFGIILNELGMFDNNENKNVYKYRIKTRDNAFWYVVNSLLNKNIKYDI